MDNQSLLLFIKSHLEACLQKCCSWLNGLMASFVNWFEDGFYLNFECDDFDYDESEGVLDKGRDCNTDQN